MDLDLIGMRQMSDKVFIDTNIFIYLYSEDEIEKQTISQMAVDKYECLISTQVLNEFGNVCIRKLNKPVKEIILAVEEIIEQCTVTIIDEQIVKQTLNIHENYGFSYFDCLMIASALNSNCKYLFSEDLADGQIIDDKLIIVNIFKQKNINKYLD